MNGMKPNVYISELFYPDKGRRRIYVTVAELWNWAIRIKNNTQEGELYHDSLDKLKDAYKEIAAFFDGSMGTYKDIMSGLEVAYPVICDWEDIRDYFADYYNTRFIYKPLFQEAWEYTDDNNAKWRAILDQYCGRIHRFCKFNKIRYQKLLQTMMLQYNPIADYWTKEKEISANAPYITIANNKDNQSGYSMDPMVADWNQVAGSVDGADNPMDVHGHNKYSSSTTSKADSNVKNEHYTTTYDDASNNRLESFDLQTGGTKTDNEQVMPSSGVFRKREEDGNKGSISPQDAVIKEFDIAELWNLVKLFCDDLSKDIFLFTA